MEPMTEQQKNEVAVWQPKPFTGTDLMHVPAPRQDDIPLVGREEMDPGDVKVPQLQLIQGMSEANQMDGAKIGMFFHTATKQLIKGPIRAVGVMWHKSNAFFPKSGDTRLACVAPDAITGRMEDGTERMCEQCRLCLDWNGRQPPEGNQAFNFILATKFGPANVRFKSTSYKSARDFVSGLTLSNHNIWDFPLIITTTTHTKDMPGGQKAAYAIMDIRWDMDDATPPDLRRTAYKTYQTLQAAHDSGRLDHGAAEN